MEAGNAYNLRYQVPVDVGDEVPVSRFEEELACRACELSRQTSLGLDVLIEKGTSEINTCTYWDRPHQRLVPPI